MNETARHGSKRAGWVYAIVFAIGCVLCGLVSVQLGQDNNWDLLNYHYYNPHAFLNDRVGYDIAPAQRQSYLNPLLDLPFYWGTRHLPPKIHGFAMGAVHGLSFGLVFALGAIMFRNFAAGNRWVLSATCAIAAIWAPVFVSELGTSFNDTLVALFMLASILIFTKVLARDGTLSRRESRRSVIVGAVIFGVGAGLKSTLMPHAAGLAIAVLFVERTWRARVWALLIVAGSSLAGFLLANGHWMAQLWRKFGNPFYPFFNDVFRSPWADPRSYADRSMIPSSFADAVALPFQFLTGGHYTSAQHGFRDVRYAILIVVILAWAVRWLLHAIFRRRRASALQLSPEIRFLGVFFVVSFVAWEASFAIFRYTAALELLAPVLIVALASACAGGGIARTSIVAALLLAEVVAIVDPIKHDRLEWGDRFWDVDVPELPSPHAMVVIATDRPWAYLIPAFPDQVQWVSVDNNLTTPTSKTKTQEEIRRLLTWFDGDIYLLTRAEPYMREYDVAILGVYGLRLADDDPLPIASRHSLSNLQLCRLRRF